MQAANRLLLGALAGEAATVAMTATMLLLWRRLPPRQRYPLPPREITERILGGPAERGEEGLRMLTMLTHFTFGAACGALFAVSARTRHPAAGAGYGLAVWGASYLGWIPAFRVLRPATRHPRERNLLMLGAHLVWGGTLALALAGLEQAQAGPIAGGDLRDRAD